MARKIENVRTVTPNNGFFTVDAIIPAVESLWFRRVDEVVDLSIYLIYKAQIFAAGSPTVIPILISDPNFLFLIEREEVGKG